MTLTADRGIAWEHEEPDRRRRSRQPRRSWASHTPFEPRLTPVNSDTDRRTRAWRSVGVRYAAESSLLDLVVAVTVGYAALVPVVPGANGAWLAIAGASAFVALVAAFGGYRSTDLGDGPTEYQSVLQAGAALIGVLMTVAFAFSIPMPRATVLIGVPAVVLLTLLGRYVRRHHLHHVRTQGVAMRSTIVVGDAESTARVVADLSAAPYHGYRVDGVCLGSADAETDVLGVPVLGAVADVVQVVADEAADVVVVTGSTLRGDALRRLSWALGRAGARMVVVPDIVEVAGPRLTVRPTAGLSLLEVEVDAPRRRLVAKQAIDVGLALLGGLVVLPVVLVSALLVRLTSRGPALFTQTRVGVDGQPFTIWKLRTMYVDADARRAALLENNEGAGLLFKMREDPRVTPVGRTLRRFSLDELPQLWNVVRGDMSLVGPRPPLTSEVAEYEDEVHRRLRVKPGLTGLWQVSGRSDLAWDEAVRLDLRYVDNWSVSMDLMILWKTGRAVLRGQGAY